MRAMPSLKECASFDSPTDEPVRMVLSQALFETRRCLYCYDAPCALACPVHIDVPGFIKRLSELNVLGSSRLLFESNPLATVCGAVCPTAQLCEGACVLRKLGQRPIRIGALQLYVAGRFDAPEPAVARTSPGRVAVVGGGPSGIGCAVSVRRLGHEVRLLDRAPKLGGLLSQVIPAHRLPEGALARDLSRLANLGIDFRLGAEVDRQGCAKVLRDYDALFLGIGLGGTERFAVPGAELAGVEPALGFLSSARASARGEAPLPKVGAKVVVVGGGNAAVDTAATARSLGAETVIVLYRRTLDEMPAWHSEYLEAASMGVEFRWLSAVRGMEGDNRGVSAVLVQPMRRAGVQPDGRRAVEADPGAYPYRLACDQVLLALGQSLSLDVAQWLGLSVDQGKTIAADPATFETSRSKVFAAGEATMGGSTVVASVAQGMAAGRAIHQWLLK